ncbi:MAG: hypothetical protein AB7C97_09170 [Oscillospiraceae bacterium]
MTFERAGKVLDTLVDELPAGLLRDMNGGINLVPEAKPSDGDDLYTLGEYHQGGPMGRFVTLYYGSFERLFKNRSEEAFKKQLKKTLYHELTHHVESLAGDRTLEREDERFMADYEAKKKGDPLQVDSALFVSGTNAGRSAVAEGIFRSRLRQLGIDDMECGSAVLTGVVPGAVDPAAAAAALEYGADISGCKPQRLTKSMLQWFDAVFCMTEDEADGLADDYPEFDARIFALGQKDIFEPAVPSGWKKCAKRIAEGVDELLDELLAEDVE